MSSMEVTLETRKPINHLTVSDLSVFPVWEFATDEEGIEGRDETWVRPLDTQVVPRGLYSLSVAVEFTAACGRKYDGFVEVTTANTAWTSGPVDIYAGIILQGSNYLPVPRQKELYFAKRKEALLSQLGLSDSDLFPITYTLRVLIEGEQTLRSGVLG
jgi:hypothetical protein